MEDKVRVLLCRKVSSLLVLLFFAVHTNEVTDAVISLHDTLKVDVVRVSFALP